MAKIYKYENEKGHAADFFKACYCSTVGFRLVELKLKAMNLIFGTELTTGPTSIQLLLLLALTFAARTRKCYFSELY